MVLGIFFFLGGGGACFRLFVCVFSFCVGCDELFVLRHVRLMETGPCGVSRSRARLRYETRWGENPIVAGILDDSSFNFIQHQISRCSALSRCFRGRCQFFFFKWFAHILFLSGTFFLSKMSLNSVNYFIFPIDRFSFRKLISIDSRNSKCCKGNRVIGDLWKGARRFSRTQSSSTDKRRPVAKRAVRLNRFHSIAFHNCWTMCLGCRFFAEMKHRGARVQKENFRVLPMGIRGLFT